MKRKLICAAEVMTPQFLQRQATCRELLTQTLAGNCCTLTLKHQSSVKSSAAREFHTEISDVEA